MFASRLPNSILNSFNHRKTFSKWYMILRYALFKRFVEAPRIVILQRQNLIGNLQMWSFSPSLNISGTICTCQNQARMGFAVTNLSMQWYAFYLQPLTHWWKWPRRGRWSASCSQCCPIFLPKRQNRSPRDWMVKRYFGLITGHTKCKSST